jgi:hypothetical protein
VVRYVTGGNLRSGHSVQCLGCYRRRNRETAQDRHDIITTKLDAIHVDVKGTRTTVEGLGATIMGADQEPMNDEVSIDARAVAIFIQNPGLTKRAVADRIGYNVRTLNADRCPLLADAIAAHRASHDPTRRVVRGTKSKDGDLDGYEE